MPKTTREVTVRYLDDIGHGCDVTVPEGTELTVVENGEGTKYAVKSIALLERLTGNRHDPKYRYCVVPEDVVDVLHAETNRAPAFR